jgi:hypothetical protein
MRAQGQKIGRLREGAETPRAAIPIRIPGLRNAIEPLS